MFFKWYGSKEKAMEAIMQSTGDVKEFKQEQDKNTEIYKKFMAAKETGDANVEKEAVEQLAENYKEMFKLDNARSILLDLASEYLQNRSWRKLRTANLETVVLNMLHMRLKSIMVFNFVVNVDKSLCQKDLTWGFWLKSNSFGRSWVC